MVRVVEAKYSIQSPEGRGVLSSEEANNEVERNVTQQVDWQQAACVPGTQYTGVGHQLAVGLVHQAPAAEVQCNIARKVGVDREQCVDPLVWNLFQDEPEYRSDHEVGKD